MPDLAGRSLARRLPGSLSFQLLLLVGVVIAYNRVVYGLRSVSGTGEFSTWAAPLYAFSQSLPSLSIEILVRWLAPLLIGILWIVIALRWINAHGSAVGRIPSLNTLLLRATLGFIIILNITTAMMDDGVRSIAYPFSFTGKEYFGDTAKVGDPIAFLRDYPTLNLSHHPRTHPPGGVMFLWLIRKLFGPDLMPAALGAIVVTALSIVPATLLARRFLSERGVAIFVAMYVLTPNLVLFGATCMDGVFAFFALWAAYFFFTAAGDDTRGLRFIVRAINVGFWLALFTFFTYASLVLVSLFITWWIIQMFTGSQRALRTLLLLAIAAITLVACFEMLYVLTGCNILACVKASIGFDGDKMRLIRIGYWDVGATNVLGFLVGSGIIAATLWLRDVVTGVKTVKIWRLKSPRQWDASDLSVALAMTILAMSFSKLFTRELERVWMFLTPMLLIGAADALDRLEPDRYRFRWISATLVLLFTQTWLTQLLLYTVW